MNPVSTLKAKLPTPLRRLADLAYNYWWSWSEDRVSLFSTIDPSIWQACRHNPVVLLEAVSGERLWQVAEDPHYLNRLNRLASQFDHYLADHDTWAARVAPEVTPEFPIAYFCMEFGLHESLPIYCGGLGVLAGDHLKSASDLGLPMVGIGLLYRQGYFRQRLNRSGWQQAFYEDNDFEHMPLELVRDEFGQPVTVKLKIRQRVVRIQVWNTQVGRVQLYLLDTDRPDNDPVDRRLTGHLYGGNRETHIAQEMVLGIGGVRVLHALEIEPSFYHLNEGHAAFALLEATRLEMAYSSDSFFEAEDRICQKSIFTTHTPVISELDAFSADMMESFLADYWPQLGLTRERFLALGARRPGDPWEMFSMTVLALRMSRAANGVSRRHGEVSRDIWQVLYPDQPLDQVPIQHVTNGVHARTWTAPLMADLYNRYLGEDWSRQLVDPERWAKVDEVPDAELWRCHSILKERLIAYARVRVLKSRLERGEAADDITAVDRLLDPHALTLGFARRFSPYKRGALLFSDLHRAIRILSNPKRPIQIIYAGKAHPDDDEGKRIIQRLMEWCRHPALRDRIAFIEDYDIYTTKLMVQGVDVWLNTPRRPLEASGTSGQKAAFNGVLNLSILDGWWHEGYQEVNGQPLNGWTIGEDLGSADQQRQNQVDAESLYNLLQHQIAPLFYDRDHQGIPRRWLTMMKASIRSLCPVFNSDRMVAEYVTQLYLSEQPDTSEPVMASLMG